MKEERYQEAARYLQDFLQDGQQGQILALQLLGDCLAALGQETQALQAYEIMWRNNQLDPLAAARRFIAYEISLGLTEKARRHYTQALENLKYSPVERSALEAFWRSATAEDPEAP